MESKWDLVLVRLGDLSYLTGCCTNDFKAEALSSVVCSVLRHITATAALVATHALALAEWSYLSTR